jgi:uncharacterized membrane protein YbaN (DUF454 family)
MRLFRKNILKVFGFIFVGIGFTGIFIPVLPTTPFLIVAAACFARSSKRWHEWLLSNKYFGPILMDWREKRCIKRAVKTYVILIIIVIGSSSVLLLNGFYPRIFCSLLLLTGLFVVIRIKVCK